MTPSAAIERATSDIQKALTECDLETIQKLPVMQQAIQLAQGMKVMREALSKQVVEELLVPLQGSPLGFRTDRDAEEKGPYPWHIVRDCAVEAMIRGFNVVGNEFNIIASRAYFTKEGLERRVNEFAGISNLDLRPGVPVVKEGGALVAYHASWRINSVADELICDVVPVEGGPPLDRRIPVRVNSGMGVDGILGKAKRKMYARILERLTGMKIEPQAGDVLDTTGESMPDAETRSPLEQKKDELLNKHRTVTKSKPGEDYDPKTGEMKPPIRREPGDDDR